MKIYDMHCHIDLIPSMSSFADDALRNDIGILAVTTTPKVYEKEISILHKFKNIRVALGLHPQLVSSRYNELKLIEKYIDEAAYIGEVGLDFNKEFYTSKEKQIDIFENIIKWSSRHTGKVISIHAVHADKMVLDILEKYSCTNNNNCIFHWFSGTLQQLQRAIEMNCLFSINSTMLKSRNGQNLLHKIPLKNILLESDAPFVGEIKTVKSLKDELGIIQTQLTTFFGDRILTDIQNKSSQLLDI